MEEASDEEKLTVAKEIYSKHWATSSEHFLEEDYYDWMAKQLSPYKPEKIFDLGTGSGNSIVELYQRFNSKNLHIISIDENIKCLENASNNIFEKLKIEPYLQARITPEFKGEIHRYLYDPVEYPSDSKVVLLESDFLSEPCLDDIEKVENSMQ
jgi:SAM-dependent methyltransferase